MGGGSEGAEGIVEPGGVVPGIILMGGGMLICPGVPASSHILHVTNFAHAKLL